MSNISHDYDKNYTLLAVAIAKQAARDYEDALCRLHKNPNSEAALALLKDCEDFFKKDIGYYFDCDGEYIMNQIRKIVADNGYRKKRAINMLGGIWNDG